MMVDPGVIERNSGPDRSWFALGSIDASTRGREEDVAALLRHTGTVDIVDDIRSAKWMKLVSNSTTLVTTAILGLPMLEAVAQPGMRELMLRSGQRSEEHTSELQSLMRISYAVFCLKKKHPTTKKIAHTKPKLT